MRPIRDGEKVDASLGFHPDPAPGGKREGGEDMNAVESLLSLTSNTSEGGSGSSGKGS
jgi:hypothetical protein